MEVMEEFDDNLDLSNELTLVARDKLVKSISKHYDRLKTAKAEIEEAFPVLITQAKSYLELLTLSSRSIDEELKNDCAEGIDNLKAEFESLVSNYEVIQREMSAIKSAQNEIADYSLSRDEFPDVSEVLEAHRASVREISNGWMDKWKTEITEELTSKPTEEQLEEAIENDGLAFMESSKRVCPILQTEMSGEALKNPTCGHIYSKDGFNHLFINGGSSRKCPVAACPHQVLKRDVVSIQV